MSGLYQRYALDPVGNNPDNLVIEEGPHNLSNRELRFFVPDFAPFYVDSLIVYDGVSKTPLRKDQFVAPTVSQEASLKYGQDIADSILILDKTVSSSVYVTYQALGGNYQNNIKNVINIYEAFLNDHRAIDWVDGVYGKPSTYPPSLHTHYITEIFGFETLTFVLEQIKQAILISYSPAWDMLLEALKNKAASRSDIDQGLTNERLVQLDVLQYAANRYNFNTITMTPEVVRLGNGRRQRFEISASNAPSFDRYIWHVEHITTTNEDFKYTNGYVDLSRGEGAFELYTTESETKEPEKKFRIILSRGTKDNYRIYESKDFVLARHSGLGKDSFYAAMSNPCYNAPNIRKTASMHAMSRRIWNAVKS